MIEHPNDVKFRRLRKVFLAIILSYLLAVLEKETTVIKIYLVAFHDLAHFDSELILFELVGQSPVPKECGKLSRLGPCQFIYLFLIYVFTFLHIFTIEFCLWPEFRFVWYYLY